MKEWKINKFHKQPTILEINRKEFRNLLSLMVDEFSNPVTEYFLSVIE